jgi:L-fuculose-phosphate aldolase
MCSRDDVIATARRMAALGLVIGTFGNVSCRLDERILMTPSGLDYEAMRPEDLVLLTLTGDIIERDRVPSSEHRLHVAIYARLPEVRAIVHTHSPWAVAAAEGRHELLIGDSTVRLGPVPVAPYQPPGTQELADRAVDLLVGRNTNTVILDHHGVVGVGRDLDEALEVCRDVERLAEGLK